MKRNLGVLEAKRKNPSVFKLAAVADLQADIVPAAANAQLFRITPVRGESRLSQICVWGLRSTSGWERT
jgi:hypothetical protein